MVSDTRSTQKSKDEGDGHSPKKKNNIITDPSPRSSEKADISGVRRSGREISESRQTSPSPQSMCKSKETSVSRQTISCPQNSRKSKETKSSRQTTPSPQSMRKSKRLDAGTLSSSPVNKKSERLEKYNAPTPQRRSRGGRNSLSSSSSGSKKLKKPLSHLQLKRKKKKDLIQVTLESEKVDLQPFSMKRKKMNARNFKASFKRQRIQEVVPDGDGGLEAPNKSSQMRNNSSRGIDSESMRNQKNGAGNLTKDIALQKSTFHADNEEDSNMHSSFRENVVDEPYPIDSQTSFSVREPFDFSQRLPAIFFSNEDVDVLESESSTCRARSRDGSMSSESHEKCIHSEGTMPSPPPKCGSWDLLETCVQCLKKKRVGYDSPEEELCTCNPTVNDDPCGFFAKDRNDHGAAITSKSAEKCLQMERNAVSRTVDQENICGFCFEDGELLCCAGKGCKRCYHIYCLDPSLPDALPGVWHCPQCVKKKLLFGVHSVSQGVEFICDVREVELSSGTGDRQKQYLVKYNELAHIHNHWGPENQLLLENPSRISDFIENTQIVRWHTEWTVPHRLLRKRAIHDKVYIASTTVISVCNYEWLVKWHGLGYDHATWELDCAPFLSSPLGEHLMKYYEIWHQRANREVIKVLWLLTSWIICSSSCMSATYIC